MLPSVSGNAPLIYSEISAYNSEVNGLTMYRLFAQVMFTRRSHQAQYVSVWHDHHTHTQSADAVIPWLSSAAQHTFEVSAQPEPNNKYYSLISFSSDPRSYARGL